MENYCAFSKNHKCMLWSDYEVTRSAFEDANTLCHENWIDIQHKQKYIDILQKLLSDNDISFPSEYEI